MTILVLHICDAPPPSSNWHHVELQIPSSSGDMCEIVCGNIGSLYQPLNVLPEWVSIPVPAS